MSRPLTRYLILSNTILRLICEPCLIINIIIIFILLKIEVELCSYYRNDLVGILVGFTSSYKESMQNCNIK